MRPLIRPLEAGDLPELSRFLTAGFHTAADADFAAPEVLAWKYLGPDASPPRSYVARDEDGALVGHVGICRTDFHGPGLPASGVSTLHMIDWLGSPGQPSVGASLMRRAHEGTDTQFGLGGSDAGRTVIKRGGYLPRPPIPVFQRVLRPTSWLQIPGLRPWEKAARMARDGLAALGSRTSATPSGLELHRVDSFGAEIEPIVAQAARQALLTGRSPARLNHLLRFPRQAVSGWQLVEPSGRPVGFAVLNVVPQHGGRIRLGKIVDLVLEGTDAASWRAAAAALTRELARQGADVAQAYAGPPWVAAGLRAAGYRSRFALEFSLRDRRGLVPAEAPFHLTPIEADYAYT